MFCFPSFPCYKKKRALLGVFAISTPSAGEVYFYSEWKLTVILHVELSRRDTKTETQKVLSVSDISLHHDLWCPAFSGSPSRILQYIAR